MKLLVVEDERRMLELLRQGLSEEGHTVSCAADGVAGLQMVRDHDFDVVILDVMMPKMDGFELAKHMRTENNSTPVLMLTAKDSVPDIVNGLDVGADDYVTKPFSVGELVARINAIFRRLHRSVHLDEAVSIGSVVVYPRRHELVRKGKSIPLSFYEVELVRLLVERAGEPVSREEILEKIWGVSGHSQSRAVDNFVVKLRKKIEDDASNPRHIVTIYGIGYKLVA